MYNGGLVTLRFKDREALVSIPLSKITVELKEEGILIVRKETNKEIGYLVDIIGLDLNEFMTLMGYEPTN